MSRVAKPGVGSTDHFTGAGGGAAPARMVSEATAVWFPTWAVSVTRPDCFAVIVASPFSTRRSAIGGSMDPWTEATGRPVESIAEKEASSPRASVTAEGVTAKKEESGDCAAARGQTGEHARDAMKRRIPRIVAPRELERSFGMGGGIARGLFERTA